MPANHLPAGLTIDLDDPGVVIVVGADLRAETFERPIANALLNSVNAAMSVESESCGRVLPAAVICTDVLYLNSEHLRLCPTLSVGGPELNALSAYLIGRVPPVFAVEGRYAVHADLAGHQLAGCIWGVDSLNTAHAMEVFCEKHLQSFVKASVRVEH